MACDNCKNNGIRTKEAMTARVDAIIDRIGTSRRDIIPLLQALQDEFSYLPSDALLRVYERTEIDRAQLISVSIPEIPGFVQVFFPHHRRQAAYTGMKGAASPFIT